MRKLHVRKNVKRTLRPTEVERVLQYLEDAPVVIAAPHYVEDEMDPANTHTIKYGVHTDRRVHMDRCRYLLHT